MKRFDLEDFFYQFEHAPEYINLASSDAQPWDAAEIGEELRAATANVSLHYPDVKAELLPHLKNLCGASSETEVLPTSGAAEAIALVMHELFDAGCNGPVAMPAPGYGAFHGLASLLRLPVKTYEYSPGRNWTPSPDELLELSDDCAALIINNPHNPSGHVLPDDFIRSVAQRLGARNAVLILDEVFQTRSGRGVAAGFGRHVVMIGSLSKMYGLPGLRLGWIAAASERISRLRTLQQYLTLTLNSLAVTLGATVLKDPQRFDRSELVRNHRNILIDWAAKSDGTFSISQPLGGTTACLTVNSSPREDADALFERFRKAGVLLAPGPRCFDFGHELNWFRLGYAAVKTEDLRRGLALIAEVLRQ